MNPKISIITINYNNSEGLEKTIKSVLCQDYPNIEYIVIDGGSTDDSVDIIKKYSSSIHYWVSEKDGGIYNAQNKGLQKTKGEYLLFLNSGDLLENEKILSTVFPFLDGTDIIYGDLVIRELHRDWVKKYDSKLTFSYFFTDTLPHQGAFLNRNLFFKTGTIFDESFCICADWKFFIDAICKHNATTKYLKTIISIYDYSGLSSKAENWTRIVAERELHLKQEYALFYPEIIELMQIKYKADLLNLSFFIKLYLKTRKLFGKADL